MILNILLLFPLDHETVVMWEKTLPPPPKKKGTPLPTLQNSLSSQTRKRRVNAPNQPFEVKKRRPAPQPLTRELPPLLVKKTHLFFFGKYPLPSSSKEGGASSTFKEENTICRNVRNQIQGKHKALIPAESTLEARWQEEGDIFQRWTFIPETSSPDHRPLPRSKILKKILKMMDAIDLDVDGTREEAGIGGRDWDVRQEMRKKTEAEDRNTNHFKARVQAVAASTKARSTIPMLGKGSKTRQGRGEEAGVTPSKRSTGIHLVIQPQPAGPGWIFWDILTLTNINSDCFINKM